MPNEELKARVLKRAVENFLKTGRGTKRFQLISEFRERNLTTVIHQLLGDGALRREMSGNLEEYAPSITGIYLSGNQDAIRTSKAAFILVGGILRDVFFEQPGNLGVDVPVLLERAQKIDQAASTHTVLLGFYMLQDVGLTMGYRLGEAGEVEMVNTSEQLAVVPDFEAEWDDQIRSRLPRSDQQDQVADLTVQGLEADLPDVAVGKQLTTDPPDVAVGKQLTTDPLDLPLGKLTSWQKVGLPLGSGGQGDVWLVRTPQRSREIHKGITDILVFSRKLGPFPTCDDKDVILFAKGANALSREEQSSDLGALKQYKIPEGPDGDLAVARLRREIQVLKKGGPGLLKLLDSSESERWIVTEYLPRGSLAKQISLFEGQPYEALTAFRTLVEAVSQLHNQKIIHRDIKPPNIFVRSDEELVLGDFGIVYVHEDADRVTMLNEKVGARDYMPPWAPIDERQETVEPNFDVYMLGKLLWCMVAGRLKLLREYHKKPENNLEARFPKRSDMRFINEVLDACLTEDKVHCLDDASKLLELVDQTLGTIKNGGRPLDVPRPCRICGKGFYQSQGYSGSAAIVVPKYEDNMHAGSVRLVPFVCDYCQHFQFFAPGYPPTR